MNDQDPACAYCRRPFVRAGWVRPKSAALILADTYHSRLWGPKAPKLPQAGRRSPTL
jgi:hypothetical protein